MLSRLPQPLSPASAAAAWVAPSIPWLPCPAPPPQARRPAAQYRCCRRSRCPRWRRHCCCCCCCPRGCCCRPPPAAAPAARLHQLRWQRAAAPRPPQKQQSPRQPPGCLLPRRAQQQALPRRPRCLQQTATRATTRATSCGACLGSWEGVWRLAGCGRSVVRLTARPSAAHHSKWREHARRQQQGIHSMVHNAVGPHCHGLHAWWQQTCRQAARTVQTKTRLNGAHHTAGLQCLRPRDWRRRLASQLDRIRQGDAPGVGR